MGKQNKIQLFQEQKVRTHWDENKEKWYFSIIDIVAILTESPRPRKYWNALKSKLKAEGSQLSQDMGQLKMESSDGKKYLTDVADTEQLLRLIQSIPSPKAEPFKIWLAKVGYERIEETEDPELAFERAMATYLKKGYSREWINQRLKSIEVRKELTDEWQERGMEESSEYSILTNEITKAWSDKTVKNYKRFKGLKKENLRDNMSNLELVLNMLAEASTTEISKEKKPTGLEANKDVARKGGNAARKARVEIEKQTGKPIVTSKNAQNFLDKSDKDKYTEVSGAFKKLLEKSISKGKSPQQFMDFLLKNFGNEIMPYWDRFLSDVKGGKIKLDIGAKDGKDVRNSGKDKSGIVGGPSTENGNDAITKGAGTGGVKGDSKRPEIDRGSGGQSGGDLHNPKSNGKNGTDNAEISKGKKGLEGHGTNNSGGETNPGNTRKPVVTDTNDRNNVGVNYDLKDKTHVILKKGNRKKINAK